MAISFFKSQKTNEQLFLENLSLIDETSKRVCRMNSASADEMEEFVSHVKMKFIENDYEVLRKYQRRSSLKTYLSTVINHLFIDLVVQRRGRWRSSREAQRAGEVGVKLEELLIRHHYTFDEACEILKTKYNVELSTSDLHDLASKLRPRKPRSTGYADEEMLAMIPDRAAEIKDLRIDPKSERRKEQIQKIVSAFLTGLDAEDRLILKMRFQDDIKVSTIAQILKVDQKKLYRRIEAMLQRVKDEFEKNRIPQSEILELAKTFDREISFEFGVDNEGK